MTEEKQIMGKKARLRGQAFERKVRKDLEIKGWIVAKWSNNFELHKENSEDVSGRFGGPFGKIVPAKSNRFNMRSTGFPDFIAFRKKVIPSSEFRETQILKENIDEMNLYQVCGVEVKSTGHLDKEEKAKCQWLLDNKVFSKIFIVSKKESKIKYEEIRKS